jgi:hypothetical protein
MADDHRVQLEKIPSFGGDDGDESRVPFWVASGAHGTWHVMYRDDGRELSLVACGDEKVAAIRVRVLNRLFEAQRRVVPEDARLTSTADARSSGSTHPSGGDREKGRP